MQDGESQSISDEGTSEMPERRSKLLTSTLISRAVALPQRKMRSQMMISSLFSRGMWHLRVVVRCGCWKQESAEVSSGTSLHSFERRNSLPLLVDNSIVCETVDAVYFEDGLCCLAKGERVSQLV